MSKRKLWATKFELPGDPMTRHGSQAAVYRYVENERANWAGGALRTKRLTVYVDERDGRGFVAHERIDLSE